MTETKKRGPKKGRYNENDLMTAYHEKYATLGGVARALGVSHPEAEERYARWLIERAEDGEADH